MQTSQESLRHLTAGVLTGMQRAPEVYSNGLNRYFQQANGQLRKVSGLWEFLCTLVPSNKIKEIHTFFGKVPAVTEDTVSSEGASVPEYSFEVTNRNWSTSFAIDLYTRDDDQTGDMALIGQSMMENFLYHRDQHVMATLSVAATSTPVGYDGVSAINDSHPCGSTTRDNNLATVLSEATFNAGYAAMEAFTDAQNQQPALAIPTMIVTCPTLRPVAMQLATSQSASAGTVAWANAGAAVTNWVTQMSLDVLIIPMEFAATEWYLVDGSKGFKPLILQDRMKPVLSVTSPDGDMAVIQNKIVYVGRARLTCAAGYWQYIIRGNA